MWQDIKNIFYELRDYLNIPITTISKTEITLWTIVYFVMLQMEKEFPKFV